MRLFNTQLLIGLIIGLLLSSGSLMYGQSYTSNPSKAIPDSTPSGINDTIAIGVQQTDSITDLDVDLDIPHTWVGDLTVTLEHTTSGTVVTLLEAPGAPPTSESCSGDDVDATMDDAASSAAENECDTASPPAIGGTLRPNGQLSSFNGETLAGDWVLNVSDNGSGDVGTLESWTLNFTTTAGVPYNDECSNAIALECGDTETGTTINSTMDDGIAPFCSTSVAAPGVWYTVQGNGDSIEATLCGAGTTYDSRINIYDGRGGCDSLVCVTGNDDGCGFAGPSSVKWESEPCITYYILVQGFGGQTGDFELSINCDEPPVALNADAGSDAAFCYDGGSNSTVLGGSPTGSGGHYLFDYNYSWSPQTGLDDPSSSNPVAGGPSLTPGTYNYTVTVTDTCGWTATDEVTVEVYENPTANAGADQSICFDEVETSLNGSASGGEGPYSYSWSPSANLSSTSIAAPTFTAPAPGDYTYTLTVTDDNGCQGTDEVTITVDPEPMAEAGSDTSICEGESAMIGGNPTADTGTAPYTYSWSPNTAISSTSAANPTVNPNSTITYTVTVTDANGCEDSDTVRVKVFPETPVSFSGLADEYCGNDACVTLTGSPSGGTFSGPGVTDGPGDEGTFCPSSVAGGTYEIIYSYTDVNGCVNGDTQTTTVDPALVVEAGADTTICDNTSIELGGSPSASGGVGSYTYSWAPTDYIDDPSAANPTFTPTAIPSYSYTLTVTDENGCEATDVININTNPAPVAEAGPDKETCTDCPGVVIGGEPTASDGNGTLDYSYSWSPSSGLNDAGSPNPVALPSSTTTYTVTVTDNVNGCEDVDEVTVTVHPLPSVSIDGLSDSYCSNGGDVTLSGTPSGGTFYGDGVSGTTTTTEVFKLCYDGGPRSIPDNGLPLNVIMDGDHIQGESLGDDVVLDSVSLIVDHEWVGDLSVTLQSPGGTNVVLVDRPGVPATAFGCSGENIRATFLPGTGNSAENQCNSYQPAIAGNFTAHPGNNLADLNDGSNPNGTWTLEFTDIIAGNTGEFLDATLYFSSEGAASAGASFDPSIPTEEETTIYYAYTDSNGCSNVDSQTVTINEPPIVAAGPDETICSNETVTLGSNPVANGNGPFTYSWVPSANLDDATAENPVYTPTSGGTTTFTVTVTDANGCEETDEVTITVNEAPTADAGADAEICVDGSVAIGGNPTASGGTSPYNYSWLPAFGLDATNTANPTFTPASPGNYSYTVTVTDDNGCEDTDVVDITVNDVPTVDAGEDQTICSNESTTLNGSATGNDPFTYSWSPSANLDDATSASPTFTPSSSGSVTFTLTVTDDNGCSNTDEVTIDVDEIPTVDAGSDATICENDPYQLGGSPTATSPSGDLSYNWSPSANLDDATIANPTVSGLSTTTTFTVTVTDNVTGCVTSDDITINVNPLPVVSFSGLSAEYCIDDNTNYVVDGSPAGGTFSGPLQSQNYGGAQYPVNYTMTPVAIPDNQPAGITLSQTVSLPGNTLGTDVTLDSVSLVVDHDAVGDLEITLTSPDGTVIDLIDHPTPGFRNDIDASFVWGTGNGATTTKFPYPSIEGSFTALNGDDVNDFNNGQDPNGQWNLVVADNESGDDGDVIGVTLHFSGPAMAFNPSMAGVGTHLVTYSYTDSNGCTNVDSQTTVVNPLPQPSFTGLEAQYCYDATPDTLHGTPSGGTFSGPGVSDINFIPAGASNCSYTLNMFDSWGDGWNGGELEVYVDGSSIGTFAASGSSSSASILLEDGQTLELEYSSGFFESENTYELLDENGTEVFSDGPSPSTGTVYTSTVSLPGGCTPIMDTIFDPSAAGAGTHTIYYTYVDGNGCSNVDSQTTTVLDPVVADAGDDVQICAYDGEMAQLGGSPAATGGTGSYSYSWAPTSNLDDPTSASPMFTQPGPGSYSYTLTVTDNFGCQDSDVVNVQVDTIPEVSFTGLDSAYCVNGMPDTLEGTPEGGTFSGPGVIVDSSCVGGGSNGVSCTPATPLTTTFNENNGQDGNMFDIVAKNDVEIQSFDVHLDGGSATFEIYTKTGTHQGFENNSGAWTLVTTTTVTGQGNGVPTPLNLNMGIPISAGNTQAFYVTTLSTTIEYTNGSSQGSVYTQDANIQFLEGVGKSYPFGATFTPRVWNGNIIYDVCTTSNSVQAAPEVACDYEITISGNGYMDEVSWTFTDNTGAVVGSGGPYGYATTNTHTVTSSNPPNTFFIETQGIFNDNDVNYTITSGGVTLASGFVPGGSTETETGLNGCKGSSGPACASTFNDVQTEQNPTSGNLTFTFNNVPANAPLGGTLDLAALGDLDGTGGNLEEWEIFDENGNSIGQIGATGNFGDQCDDITNTISLTQSQIQSWAADGTITFTAVATPNVNHSLCSGDYLTLELSYCSQLEGGECPVLFVPDSAGVGTHWITYTFEDGNGCIAVDSQQTTVYPLADINIEPDTSVCRGEPVELTATASGTPGPYTYSWQPAEYLDDSTGATVTATPDSTTMFTVTVTDARGCSNVDSIQLVIHQPPVVGIENVTGTDSVCYNDEVCLWADVRGVVEDAPVPELMYYKFDQSGQSIVDNNASSPVGTNPAPIQGNLAQTGNGQFGSALQGTGSSSASNFLNTGWNTDFGGGSWTISFWTHRVPWNFETWSVFGDPSAAGLQCLISNGNNPGSAILQGPFPPLEIPAVSYGPSIVTFVHDSATQTVKGYRDGQLINDVTYNGTLNITGSGPFKVGGSGTQPGLSNGMLVDEFRVYDRALSDQKVAATVFYELGDSTGLTYVWSNGAPDNDTICFTAQQSEVITVDVIDENGCVGRDTFDLTVNPEIVVEAGPDTTVCKGRAIELGGSPTGMGGVGDLTYRWAPAERISDTTVANPMVSPLINTVYTVTVTDSNDCSWSDEVSLTVEEVPLADAGGDEEICLGESVVIGGTPSASGGKGPYTYEWQPTAGLSDPNVANPVASPDTTTFYTLTITDAKGCSDDSLMKVEVRPLPDVTIDSVGPLCENAEAIMLTAATAGGSWSGSGIVNASGGTFDPGVAGPGTHTVTYTNTNIYGCEDSDTSTITVTALPTPEITGDLSYCLNEGIVTLSATPAGGTWTGNGITDNDAGTFDPQRAGLGSHMVVYSYTDTTTDTTTACTGYDTAMVSVSEAPEVSIDPVNVLCQSDDPITLEGTPSGGVWSGPGITDSTAGTFDPSTAGVGTHVVIYTYTDANGCTVSAEITVEVEGIANLDITAAGPFCEEESNTVLSANVGGGYWSGPGIVNPLIGEFNPTAAGAGMHTITYAVTESGGCVTIAEEQIQVDGTPNAMISEEDALCANANPITLSAATGGGQWSGNGITDINAGTFDPSVAGAGTHIITYDVTDANGCTNTSETTIKVNELPVISGSVKDQTCAGSANGKIDVRIEGGAPPYQYSWSNGSITEDIDDLAAGTYNFTVTDAKGCASEASFEVDTQSSALSITAIIDSATTPIYNNGSIDLEITSGGVAPFSYNWSNGAETQDIDGLRPDTYTVVITDAVGCTTEKSYTVAASYGVGIDDPTLSDRVELFPNPTSDMINVEIEVGARSTDMDMTVFDMLGRKVYEVHEGIDKHYEHAINVEEWASGQYMIRFNIDGTLVTKKFVISR